MQVNFRNHRHAQSTLSRLLTEDNVTILWDIGYTHVYAAAFVVVSAGAIVSGDELCDVRVGVMRHRPLSLQDDEGIVCLDLMEEVELRN